MHAAAPPRRHRGAHRDPARADHGASTARWARRSSATAPTRPATAASASPTGPATSGQQRPADAHPAATSSATIHREYLEAGADIIETNTFNANAISLADYGLEDLAYELNLEAARLARAAADAVGHRRPAALRRRRARPDHPHRLDLARRQRPRRPQRLASTSSSTAYLERGPRPASTAAPTCCLIETIFDTLNAKAAIFAVETLFEEHGRRWPVIISGTITDASGRTLSGQVTEAFWDSVRHARPLAVGLNCALGAQRDAPLRRRAVAARRLLRLRATPTPACPTPSASTTRRPTRRPRCSASSPTPASSTSSAAAAAPRPTTSRRSPRAVDGKAAPRGPRPRQPAMRLSGLEPLTITEDSLFVNVGERTNITGSARFRNLIKDGDYDTALAVAAQQVENGAQVIDVNMDEGMIDGVAAMDRFLKLIASRARHQPGPGDGRLLQVGGHRGRPQVRAGQADRQLDLDEGGRGDVPRARPAVPQVRRRRGRDGLRRGRPGRQPRAPQGDLRAGLPDPRRRGRLPARGHHLRPQRLRRRDRHRGARDLRPGLHRGHPLDQGEPARRQGLRRHLQRLASPSAATTRCARRSTPSSSSTPSRPASTWASSTPARWWSTTRSTPSCASGSRTSSSTAAPTPPSGCSRSPRRYNARRRGGRGDRGGVARAAGRRADHPRPGQGHRRPRRGRHRGAARRRSPTAAAARSR